MTRTPKLIASAFLVLTLATACGGGDDGDGDGKSAEGKSETSENRPSVDEISAFFLSGENALGDVKEEQADCVAEAFYDSDLSDDLLTALVAKDADYEPSEADQNEMAAISEDWMKECMGGETPSS